MSEIHLVYEKEGEGRVALATHKFLLVWHPHERTWNVYVGSHIELDVAPRNEDLLSEHIVITGGTQRHGA